MEHPIYRVVSFERVGPCVLLVTFDDGQKQRITDFHYDILGTHCIEKFKSYHLEI